MENINTNSGTSTSEVIVTRAGQAIPNAINNASRTIPSVSGILIPMRNSPQNIMTTLVGLVSKRSTATGLAYIYVDGDVYIFPSILSTPTLSLSLPTQKTPVVIINELRGNNRPATSGFVRVTPTDRIENQYYASAENPRTAFRIIVEGIRPVVNSMNMTVDYIRNINSDERQSQRPYDCEKYTPTRGTTTVVVYNFVEPTGVSITVEPGDGVTLIGSGEIAPANSVVFSVSSDGLQLRRIFVAPLLKAVHENKHRSLSYTHL